MKIKQEFDKELFNRWNGRIKEQGYTRTHKPCIFIDTKCGYKWKEALAENLIEKARKYPCPHCWHKSRRLTNTEFIKRLYKVNKKNHTNFAPLEDCKGSHTQIHMIDLKTGHKFKTEVKRILEGHSFSKMGVNTSYTHKALQNKLNTLYGKNHIIALDKHITEKKKAWFKCTKHHITWKADVHNILQGHGCPANKLSHGEAIGNNVLTKFNIPHKYSYRIPMYTNKRKNLHLDFYLPQYKPTYKGRKWSGGLAIEVDGVQHRIPLNYFGGYKGFANRVLYDTRKNLYCKDPKVNILLIRIKYYDHESYHHFSKRFIQLISKLINKHIIY